MDIDRNSMSTFVFRVRTRQKDINLFPIRFLKKRGFRLWVKVGMAWS